MSDETKDTLPATPQQDFGDGGQAFPTFEQAEEWSEGRGGYVSKMYFQTGMTLRDYFAAKAMQGLCAQADDRTCKGTAEQIKAQQVAYWLNDARVSYGISDAMLQARSEGRS